MWKIGSNHMWILSASSIVKVVQRPLGSFLKLVPVSLFFCREDNFGDSEKRKQVFQALSPGKFI